jgi:hypothetical protein
MEMTIAQIVFLTALGSAYLLFVVVLAWTSHVTNKSVSERDAAKEASAPQGQPQMTQRYDHAA